MRNICHYWERLPGIGTQGDLAQLLEASTHELGIGHTGSNVIPTRCSRARTNPSSIAPSIPLVHLSPDMPPIPSRILEELRFTSEIVVRVAQGLMAQARNSNDN
ncbi:MAG: hypothetical protein ABIG95_00405 [Candidatus Woesearchaeota archaeon]